MLITDLIKDMVGEMALYGGHPVNASPEIWSSMAELVKANSTRQEYIYLIASHGSPVQTTVGIAAAHIEPLNIFAAKTPCTLAQYIQSPVRVAKASRDS